MLQFDPIMAPRRPIKLAIKKEPTRVLNTYPKVEPCGSEVSFEYFRGYSSNTPPRVFVPRDDTVHKSRDGIELPMEVLMTKMKNPSKSVAEVYFLRKDDDFGDEEDWAAELEAWSAENKGSPLKQDADFDHWMAKAHYELDQHFERKNSSWNGISIGSVSSASSSSRTVLYTPTNVQTILKRGGSVDQLMDCSRSLKKEMRSLIAAMRTIHAGAPMSKQWIPAMALENLKESLVTLKDDVAMCGRSINDLMKLLKVTSASNTFKTDEPWKGNDEVQTTIKLSKDITTTIHKLNPCMQIVIASIAENGCKMENKMSSVKLNSLKKELADLHPYISLCLKLFTDLLHKMKKI